MHRFFGEQVTAGYVIGHFHGDAKILLISVPHFESVGHLLKPREKTLYI